jgi:hypothetical protein
LVTKKSWKQLFFVCIRIIPLLFKIFLPRNNGLEMGIKI